MWPGMEQSLAASEDLVAVVIWHPDSLVPRSAISSAPL